jgi:hypothetical protein
MVEPYRRLDQDLDCAEKFSKKLKSVEGASDAAVEEHLVYNPLNPTSNLHTAYRIPY